ncbi:MAG: hypothetical protein WAU50_19670, partial [Candidatus Sulfotelmatobacter sp.]
MKLPLDRFKLVRAFESVSAYQSAILAGILFLAVLATVGCTSAITPATAASNAAADQHVAMPLIQLTPGNSMVKPGANVQFSALMSDTTDTAVTWSANGGVISKTGLFVVPNAKPGTVFQIVATSLSNPSSRGMASVAIASSSAPTGNPGSGSTPTSGPDNRYCETGDVPNFGSSDGPAAAPIACYETSMTSTPSPAVVTTVSSSANLQTAIDNANCGDTLVLQAGQTYPGFTLRAKSCDANHYITIRSSATGSTLPAEGVRATPCNAGVSSLPGRPALNCASTSNVMARVAGIAKADKIIGTDEGTNYYRLVGLEI